VGTVQPAINYLQTDDNSSRATSLSLSSGTRINLRSKIEFFRPEKFARMMELGGVTKQDLLCSLDVNLNRDNIFKAG